MSKKWYVIYCKAGQDAVAENNLVAQEIETYRPKLKCDTKTRAKGKNKCIESLFPRYMFVNVDSQVQSLGSIAYTRGVSRFVKFGDIFSTVDDRIIEHIKASEESQEIYSKYKKGDSLTVNGGCFNSLQAVFLEECGINRVFVLLEFLGNKRKVAVPEAYLSKVGS